MNDVIIEKLVVGGKGLGHLKNGMVVLVPYVIPGEEIRFQPTNTKKNYQEGVVKEVLQPSPDRLRPPCEYFGRCGGCHFQHIASTRQDLLKKDIFYDELIRSGLRFAKDSITYLSSPLRFGYRQRIRLHVQDGQIGFFQQQSHSLLAIKQCLLARPEINRVLRDLITNNHWRQVAAYVAEVEIHVNPGDGSCIFIARMNRKPRPRDLNSLQSLFADLPDLATLIIKTSDGAPVASFPAEISTLCYRVPLTDERSVEITLEPGGFCQVNEALNKQMIDQALSWLEDVRLGTVLDLFCGVGNFSLPLAAFGMSVTGIDQQRSAIRSARLNNDKNQLCCDFRRDAALQGLEKIVENGQSYDYVLLDPPRAGFKEGAALLHKLQPSKIIYISCDQATLFRDLGEICKGGYQIAAITLVDQFCQSYHLESMVLLSRI